MNYLLLIYVAEPPQPRSAELERQRLDAYFAFDKQAQDAGVLVAGEALQGVETATTVQLTSSGERLVTDGPFAETREVLGGYYRLDVPDLDAAIEWAFRCPGSQYGDRIEVRPIMEFDQP